MDELDLEADLAEIPSSLIPQYEVREVNKEIPLSSSSVQASNQTFSFAGQGEILLRWLPTPAILIETKAQSLTGPFMAREAFEAPFEVVIGDPQLEGTARLTSIREDEIQLVSYELRSTAPRPVDCARFELANGLRYWGDAVRDGSSVWAARVVLEVDGWRVTLDELPSANDRAREAKDRQGYVLTHTGRVTRKDESSFELAAADDILESLGWFLSFVRGAFTSPLLISGYAGSERVALDWSRSRVDPFINRDSWFPPRERGVLEEIFPRFYQLMNDPVWQDPMRLAVDFYLRSNDVEWLETSLLLSHATLELLAWTVFVEDTRHVRAEGFDKLGFSGRLRLLLAWAGIAPEIPAECSHLAAHFPKPEQDGPFAIGEIRNGIVHPRHRQRTYGTPVLARVDATQLAVRYVELAILKLLGYDGQVQNRLVRARWIGDTETVPWAQPPSPA